MTALIGEKLGQTPETEAIAKMLSDAIAPSDERNLLADGRWSSFDPQTATISIRGGIQREDEDQFADYNEERILAVAYAFKALEIELYKQRREIEHRRGNDHDFDSRPGVGLF
jgi:hypothetical protein